MTHAYLALADRIRGEVPELARLVQRVTRSWRLGQETPAEQDVYLESAALNLHGFYSGIERLFELIARHVDGDLPAGETWHHDLLRQMAIDDLTERPAVISQETASSLDQFRRFRHLVRNVYTFNLVPDKMKPLLADLPGLWAQLRAELLAFADFLEALAEANQSHLE